MKNPDKDLKEIRISDLTVFTIEDTKDQIDEYLKSGNKVRIIMEKVTGIDLSYIQLIYSLKKSAGGGKLFYEFEEDLSPEIRELLQNTGFTDILSFQ